MKKNILNSFFLSLLSSFSSSQTMNNQKQLKVTDIIKKMHASKPMTHEFTDINIRDKHGSTLLFYAIASKNSSLVDLLFLHKIDPKIKNNEGYAPVHEAASRNLSDIMQKLLKSNVPIDYEGANGTTPLQIATSENATETVDLLLQSGANINHHNQHGINVLHIASEEGLRPLVSLFLNENNFSPTLLNSQTINTQNTPLHKAVIAGKYEIVQDLLKAGSNIDLQNAAGKTPLACAIEYKHKKIATLLLEHGADISISDTEEENILNKTIKNLPCFVPKMLILLKIEPINGINETKKEYIIRKIEYLKEIFKKSNKCNFLTPQDLANRQHNKEIAQLLDWKNTQILENLLKGQLQK